MTKKSKKLYDEDPDHQELDLSIFKDFEDKINSLSKEKDGISYSRDEEIEAEIKFSVLLENFGRIETEKALDKFSISKKSLSNQDRYIILYKYLQSTNSSK